MRITPGAAKTRVSPTYGGFWFFVTCDLRRRQGDAHDLGVGFNCVGSCARKAGFAVPNRPTTLIIFACNTLLAASSARGTRL